MAMHAGHSFEAKLSKASNIKSLSLDGPIRVNRLRVPELNPFFAKLRFGALTNANRRFEAIRKKKRLEHHDFFLRIEVRDCIHASRPDSRYESSGHLIMKAKPAQKEHPLQIKAQFAQTISEQFVQTIPLFPLKCPENGRSVCANSLCKLFIWVGVFLGWLPCLENLSL